MALRKPGYILGELWPNCKIKQLIYASHLPPTNGSVTVVIHDHTFDPAQLDVAAGTRVTWTNGDTEAHVVAADNGLFDPGVLQPGRSYSIWLGGSGTVAYYCELHPDMKGSVVVGDGVGGEGETSVKDPASSTPPVQTRTSTGDPASNSHNSQEQLAEDTHQLLIFTTCLEEAFSETGGFRCREGG